jgi:hypothetical protein
LIRHATECPPPNAAILSFSFSSIEFMASFTPRAAAAAPYHRLSAPVRTGPGYGVAARRPLAATRMLRTYRRQIHSRVFARRRRRCSRFFARPPAPRASLRDRRYSKHMAQQSRQFSRFMRVAFDAAHAAARVLRHKIAIAPLLPNRGTAATGRRAHPVCFAVAMGELRPPPAPEQPQ